MDVNIVLARLYDVAHGMGRLVVYRRRIEEVLSRVGDDRAKGAKYGVVLVRVEAKAHGLAYRIIACEPVADYDVGRGLVWDFD